MPTRTVRISREVDNWDQIARKVRRAADDAAADAAHATEGRAKRSMSGRKSGRVYRRRGREHQASAPGEAPAIDVGALANSLQVSRTGPQEHTVYTNKAYAEVLEGGGVHLAPRPYLGPAAEETRPEFVERVRRLLD